MINFASLSRALQLVWASRSGRTAECAGWRFGAIDLWPTVFLDISTCQLVSTCGHVDDARLSCALSGCLREPTKNFPRCDETSCG